MEASAESNLPYAQLSFAWQSRLLFNVHRSGGLTHSSSTEETPICTRSDIPFSWSLPFITLQLFHKHHTYIWFPQSGKLSKKFANKTRILSQKCLFCSLGFLSYFLAHKNGRAGTIPSYLRLWKDTTLPADFFCWHLFLEVGWKYHSCCWFKWKLFFVKQSLYYFLGDCTNYFSGDRTKPLHPNRPGWVNFLLAGTHPPQSTHSHSSSFLPTFINVLLFYRGGTIWKWRNWSVRNQIETTIWNNLNNLKIKELIR